MTKVTIIIALPDESCSSASQVNVDTENYIAFSVMHNDLWQNKGKWAFPYSIYTSNEQSIQLTKRET